MFTRSTAMFCLGLCVLGGAHAFDVTYKCPNHVYSNTISAKEAKDKGCTVLDNAPITVIQGNKPRATEKTASGNGNNRVDPAEQRARDSDARRILEAELKREEERLAAMKLEYNNGLPDKQGAETKNYQKYLDRVADLKAAIARKEGDVAALRRELLKYPAQ
jgi:muramoyltetrapeptide carboxypeptidase LdcA involved in peptidoglycan recycling